MTFEEAKKLEGYHFSLNGVERLLDGIRKNFMDDMEEDGDRYIGVAVLEIGYIDIELNIVTEEQVSCNPCPGNKTPVIDYFICLKNDEWQSEGYIDYWNADDWIEQLERDMFKALDAYVSKHGYHYDRPNYGWMYKDEETQESIARHQEWLGE